MSICLVKLATNRGLFYEFVGQKSLKCVLRLGRDTLNRGWQQAKSNDFWQ
jgi:hypothetical protein